MLDGTITNMPEIGTDPRTLLELAANDCGVQLTEDRLAKLVGFAEQYVEARSDPDYPYEPSFRDYDTGVFVGLPGERIGRDDGQTVQSKGIARIDFMPVINGGKSRRSAVELHEVPEVAQKAIQGMQDYVLLVTAGYQQKPDVLYGMTNADMVKSMARYGFTPIETIVSVMPESEGKVEAVVTASFDTVADHVFSERTQRFYAGLTKRLGGVGINGGTPSP